MRASDAAPKGFIDENVMGLESDSGSALEREFRLDAGSFGSHLRRASLCEVILVFDHPLMSVEDASPSRLSVLNANQCCKVSSNKRD
jgi:hypothetical protein